MGNLNLNKRGRKEGEKALLLICIRQQYAVSLQRVIYLVNILEGTSSVYSFEVRSTSDHHTLYCV